MHVVIVFLSVAKPFQSGNRDSRRTRLTLRESCVNRDVGEAHELIAILPGVELRELIRAHQEEERRGLPQRCQEVADRSESVRASGAATLHYRCREMGVAPF